MPGKSQAPILNTSQAGVFSPLHLTILSFPAALSLQFAMSWVLESRTHLQFGGWGFEIFAIAALGLEIETSER
jgi:hypothetical protein